MTLLSLSFSNVKQKKKQLDFWSNCYEGEKSKKDLFLSNYKPKDLDTDNLFFLLSFMYLSLLEFADHLPCFPINLSLTLLSAAAEAPPDLKECSA